MKTITLSLSKLLLSAALVIPVLPGLAQKAPTDQTAGPAGEMIGGPAVINHYIYLAQLPTSADLVKAAEAHGVKISRIDQTNDRIVVVYEYAGGATQTVAYALLPAAGTSQSAAAPAPAALAQPAPTVIYPQSAPTVVYTRPATVYYQPAYGPYYDPAWDFWAPLAVGLSLGWVWHDGGHYGYRGHYNYDRGGHGNWRH
ncbi:MAG: hypothetical protein ACHQ4G_09060 [Opitutales bacterium]